MSYLVYDYTADELLTPEPVEKVEAIKLMKKFGDYRSSSIIGMSVNPYRTAPVAFFYDGYMYNQVPSVPHRTPDGKIINIPKTEVSLTPILRSVLYTRTPVKRSSMTSRTRSASRRILYPSPIMSVSVSALPTTRHSDVVSIKQSSVRNSKNLYSDFICGSQTMTEPNLSEERYRNFLRIAEDIESQDYLYDMTIRQGTVNANEITLVMTKYTSDHIEQNWTVHVTASYDNSPSQIGPVIRTSISSGHSRSMTTDQHMGFINFSMRAHLVIEILTRRMSDAVRRVVNA